MFKVALCDDEKIHRELLKDALIRFSAKFGLDCQAIEFASAQELLKNKLPYDILILDIRIGEEDGIKVGQQLRRLGLTVPIILATALDDRYKDGYKADVHRYLEKPIRQSEFDEALNSAIRFLRNSRRLIALRVNGSEKLISVANIIMIESQVRYRKIYLLGEEEPVVSVTPAKEILAQLPEPDFIRVQHSFVINFNQLSSRTAATVTMTDGHQLNISRMYRALFNSAYAQFLCREEGDHV